jgi:hypothetical protein
MSSILTITPRERFLANLFPVPLACSTAIDKDTTCIICTADPVDYPVDADDEYAVVLHDRHVFGERCIREWLSENNTCPKCRHVLFEEDKKDEDDYSDFDSEYDDEDMADDMDAEWEGGMDDYWAPREVRMAAVRFSEVLAEEDYQIAASMGQVESSAQLHRFRRDFCWVRDMNLEETGEYELMEIYLDGTAFPDFDPGILPLELVTGYFEGTLPVDFDPEIMPMTAIRGLESERVPQRFSR